MKTKIQMKATGEITTCYGRKVQIGTQETVTSKGQKINIPILENRYFKDPDFTEELNQDDFEIIPWTCYELFGVECGIGWSALLQPIFDYVAEYNKDKDEEDRIEFEQIKEKFGTLRVYTNFVTEELEKLIVKAEELSANTCEQCGSTQEIGNTRGWITTLCRKCATDLAKSRGGVEWYSFDEKKLIYLQ